MKILLSILIVVTFISCQRIETGNSLGKKTTGLIRSLGLLDNDEKIIKYYSNFTKKSAGNFFTNKRVAMYWLAERDTSDNEISFAFYPDIISIDTTYQVPDTFIPYMLITRKDSSHFKVYVDGSRKEIKSFFEDAMTLWQKNK
jgi:hypothetical protein